MRSVENHLESQVGRPFSPVVGDISNPLVSIALYNYNYGQYLEECLESVVSQTYGNIEIIFSDNSSTDDSWQIASDFSKKYPGLMTMTRNRTNFGPGANLENCMFNARGEYVLILCSDDVLKPTYIEKCIDAFRQETMLGFVMVHRDIIDENSHSSTEVPFYNQSCIIPGEEQAAVYMMAAVNPSVSQVMYHKERLYTTQVSIGSTASKWYYPRIQDFHLCSKYPMAYIDEPLLSHRIHGKNDSTFTEKHLLEVLGPYVMNIEFAEVGKERGMDKVYQRLLPSIDKLSSLALRYCTRYLLADDELLAKRYFYLSAALSPDTTNSELFKQINSYWTATGDEKSRILKALTETDNLVSRTVSYDPPEGYRTLKVKASAI